VASTLERRGWAEAASGCEARRWASYVQLPGLASEEEYPAAEAGGIQAVQVVVGSPEEEAGTVQAVVDLVAGTDRVAAQAVVGYEAEVGRMHLLER
jgi:hypothetical protein